VHELIVNMKAALLPSSIVALILHMRGIVCSDIWYKAYEGAGCSNATIIAESTAAADSCIAVNLQGTTVSTKVSCSGYTAESSWSANIYMSDDCSGLTLSQMNADSACSCANAELFGYAFSVVVNCAGVQPSCPTSSGFMIYVAAYMDTSCNTDAYLVGSPMNNGQCAAYGAGDTAVSTKITCDSNTQSSDWVARIYGNGECAGNVVTQTSGSDWNDCGEVTAFGSGLSFYVNCEGSGKKMYREGDDSGSSDNTQKTDAVLITLGVLGAVLLALVLFVFIRQDTFARKNISSRPVKKKKAKITVIDRKSALPAPAANPMQDEL
jgi:hypothetical protein